MIPKTYYDDDPDLDGEPEDRAFVEDFWSWLKDQPQDTWLLWARCANWDNAEPVFEKMLDVPDCDLAIVSWLFWWSEPSFLVRNPNNHDLCTLPRKIVKNLELGYYPNIELYCSRYELVHNVHAYVTATREFGQSPIPLPRQLCGPFEGRHASIQTDFGPELENQLEEIFEGIDGWLPRSENEYWQAQETGGNLWIKDRMVLPDVPEDPVTTFRALDDLAYLEALYGTSATYQNARDANSSPGKTKRKWWPF